MSLTLATALAFVGLLPAKAADVIPVGPLPATGLKGLSAEELMSHPRYMRQWLESKDPTEIVCFRYSDPNTCLAATFMRENGYPKAHFGGWTWGESHRHPTMTIPPWFMATAHTMILRRQYNGTTAQQALSALNQEG